MGVHGGCLVGASPGSGGSSSCVFLSHPSSPARFQAVSSFASLQPLSDQVEPTDLITMPRYLQTGSTVGAPQGLWTEVEAWGPRPLVRVDVCSPASGSVRMSIEGFWAPVLGGDPGVGTSG